MPHEASHDIYNSIELSAISRAVVILTEAQGKHYCSAVLFITNAAVIQMHTELDCVGGIDFFVLTTQRHDPTLQGQIIASFGEAATKLEVSSPISLIASFDGFRGERLQSLSVSSFTISGRDGQSYTFLPDPDRWVADQMMLAD
ncbi:hypothetical protein GCM10011515_01420 [Tsuneonella deserti]|jgi:hypothetical protein|uniref:Uncharacterized protein n=1 Tax=Tsuneonella deserti TaxID=2035528 RepID=A0ABQ1RYY7_9SPHN|nr:hypothetical protein [Tsuneonella deserti]GGD85481.1 hypothetical protein GCM10011515_01420 [Tsuneonella deserti]